MMQFKPVAISKGGFRFCRYSMAVCMWAGVIRHEGQWVAFGALMMALSALLTIRNAPLIKFFDWTLGRLIKTPDEMVDESGMRLAHVVATCVMGLPLIGVYYGSEYAATLCWRFLIFVALFRTIGALGYCPVSRMFTCMLGGGKGDCCKFLRKPARSD